MFLIQKSKDKKYISHKSEKKISKTAILEAHLVRRKTPLHPSSELLTKSPPPPKSPIAEAPAQIKKWGVMTYQKKVCSQKHTKVYTKLLSRDLKNQKVRPHPTHHHRFFLAIFGNLVPIYCYKPTRVFLPIKISLYDYCYNFRNIATHNIGIIFSFLVTLMSFKNYWYMKYWYIFENEKLSVHAILLHFSNL